MIKINDYATKNHLNEWEIKELPESDVYRLDLPNGDLTLLVYLYYSEFAGNLYLPNWSSGDSASHFNIITHLPQNKKITFFFLDNDIVEFCKNNIKSINKDGLFNITPDWSKYIAKDNAVLFLSGEDANRYSNISYENFTKIIYENDTFSMQDDSLGYVKNDNVLEWNKKISIILPSIHSKNIQEISNIAKNLKKNYGVEYVEIIATHCYLKENKFVKYDCTGGYKGKASFRYNSIDKITTTDSTGVLKVQDTDKLKVVDCEEFFTNFLENDKS